MLVLDGSYGEGGGQILRTALALAALTGKTVRLENIRAGRDRPGLRPQHLTAVQALARITRASLTGADIGATALTFAPRGIFPGSYTFDVAATQSSAGSVSLIAQTLLPVLNRAESPSSLIIRGGTHVPWSPPAHYLSAVFLPALREMGTVAGLDITRWGFYPQGGGEIHLRLQPAPRLKAVTWTQSPELPHFQGLSAAANLPPHVVRRQSQSLRRHAEQSLPIQEEFAAGRGKGSFAFLWGPHAGFSALGARGKPAEQVAAEAAQEMKTFLATQAAVDRHLADQIILYAALAEGLSSLTTECLTSHLLTNIWVVEQFLPVKFEISGQMGEQGAIRVRGVAGSEQ